VREVGRCASGLTTSDRTIFQHDNVGNQTH
jgi:hypothetical protein